MADFKPHRHPSYKPAPPLWSPNLHRLLERPSSHQNSYFKVISSQYQLCDTLEVHIQILNAKNEIQQRGGDFFFAWIYNTEFRASAAADVIIDHRNGSYVAKFQLHWAGDTAITIGLVHTNDEVSILRYLRDNYPARCAYNGKFQSGNITRITPCHITTDMYIPAAADNRTKAERIFCNFTDTNTGFPWFCVKPDDLSCDTLAWHNVDKRRMEGFSNSILTEEERFIFKRSSR